MSASVQKPPTAYRIAIEAISDAQMLLKRAAGFANMDAKRLSMEMRESIRMAAGAWAALCVGGTLIGIGLVHALGALAPELPLWAGYLLTGSAALVVGAGFYSFSRARLESLEPLREQAAEIANDAVLVADQVSEAVLSTKESIQSGVDSVKSAIESARNATDINYQVEHRPWTMFIAAAGIGFVGGNLLNAHPAGPTIQAAHQGNGSAHHSAEFKSAGAGGSVHSATEAPGLVAKLGGLLAPQAELARELAIGAIFSLVRDFAHDVVAKPMAQPVDDFFNDAAKKFGGRPLARGALGAFAPSATPDEARHAR